MMRKERYWLLVLLVGALVLPVLAQSTNSTPAMGNTQDARSTGGGKYDQQIQSDINKYLQGHDQTQGVHATVEDGVVTLTGTVNRLIDKLDAEKKAHSIDHVQAVRDEIQVQSNVSDDELRLRLAQAIYGHPALQRYAMDPQAPIRIVVENGHVTLYGVVDSQMDKQIAETQAKSVPGVFSVDDKLVVAGENKQK